jgi:hypothetical protein
MQRGTKIGAVLAAIALVNSAMLRAQTPAQEPPVPTHPAPPKLDPKACTDRDRLTHGDVVESDGRAPVQGNLGDTLARTDGVICPPPGLDPHIRAPAPNTGSDMPVIPPPGTPGGNPDVRPK